MTALHWASANLWDRLGAWLIDRGADVSARNTTGQTPLDLVGCEDETRSPDRSRLSHEDRGPAPWAGRGANGPLGHRDRRRGLAAGASRGRCPDAAGRQRAALVTHAVKSERPDMLALLLDLGLDPDERERVDGLEEVVYSWGEPLRQCAILGSARHGGNPAEAGSEREHERLRRQLGDVRSVRQAGSSHGGAPGTSRWIRGRRDGRLPRAGGAIEAAVRRRSRRPFARRHGVAWRHGRRGAPVQRGRQRQRRSRPDGARAPGLAPRRCPVAMEAHAAARTPSRRPSATVT